MAVRTGGGRRRFLYRGVRSDGGEIKIDGYRRRSGERRKPCGNWRGRRGIFGMLGRRQDTPRWADDPVQGQTERPEMA